MLRDAMFIVHPEDLAKEKSFNSTVFNTNQNSHLPHITTTGNKQLMNCRRLIPDPFTLENRLQMVVTLCANVIDFRSGETLFSQKTWHEYENLLHHVRSGCLSDPPGYNLYKQNQNKLICVRGTSQLEGFHSHIKRLISGHYCSPYLSTLLIAVFIYRWNVDRSVERGLLPKCYGGYYDHYLIEEMQEMTENARRHGNYGIPEDFHILFRSTKDYVDSGEKFFTPLINPDELQHCEEDISDESTQCCSESSVIISDEHVPKSVKFEAKRMGQNLPVTKVMKCEEWLFEELMKSCGTVATSMTMNYDNHNNSINFSKMANFWNSRVREELKVDFMKRKKIFPKTATLLQDYWKTVSDRNNEKKTLTPFNRAHFEGRCDKYPTNASLCVLRFISRASNTYCTRENKS